MGNKKSIFKSIFFCLCAFCLLGGGIALWQQPYAATNDAYAANAKSEEIEKQQISDNFSVKELIVDSSAENAATPNEDSLTKSNTFLHYSEGSRSNVLKLSLKQNGATANKDSGHDVYKQVYYPDPTNLSVFYFYSVSNVSLHINGAKQEINMGNFITGNDSSATFTNKAEVQPNGFEMFFTNSPTQAIKEDGVEVDNARKLSIVDPSSGTVVEGVYELSLTFGLFLCTDGKSDATEEAFSDEVVTLTYKFHVLARDNFLANSNPNVSRQNFDKEVQITELTSDTHAYYLYSNYSSKPENSADEANAYKIPYIEYDYTRFEASISKTIDDDLLSTSTLSLDLEAYKNTISNAQSTQSPIVQSGDDIIKFTFDKTAHTARIFFYDVGNYTISLNAIKLVDFVTDEVQSVFELRKYSLSAVSGVTKKIKVFMYGYQANYTNVDAPLDENEIRPLSELKRIDTNEAKFKNGADITSGFLNSSEDLSQTNGSTSFLISKVLDYVNAEDDNGDYKLKPVKTDQAPISFTSNATPVNQTYVKSYMYSTVKANGSYVETGLDLQGEELYRTAYTGLTDSAVGKYLYVLAYTFNNFYMSETTLSTNTIFYQVFFYEIETEIPTIEIKSKRVSTDIHKEATPIDVLNDMFVNQDVIMRDTTAGGEDSYKKDVTIMLYAHHFDKKTFLSGFGGENGISFDDPSITNAETKTATFSENGHYTMRLYYTNEMTSKNISFKATTGYFRELKFTIDKMPIQELKARNFVDIVNSTNSRYYSDLDTFVSNQNLAISWKEKDSGASSTAYYRYFPIEDASYYSASASRRSDTIRTMLKSFGEDNHYMPVSHVLDMSTEDNRWLEYGLNTYGLEELSTDYKILSDEGLYLVDVYDDAGNHKLEVFMIDKTTPIFAKNTDGIYDLVSSSVFITEPCELYWGNYKSMFISKFDTIAFNSKFTADNIDEEYKNNEILFANKDFYKTKDNTTCTEIFKVLYNRLYKNSYMQHINNDTLTLSSTDKVSTEYFGNSYAGYYITIPINNKTYYVDQNHPSYISKEGKDNWFQSLTTDEEMTYRVLLRDLSNTKYDRTIDDKEHLLQYTGYYSAYQTIIVSFDDSEFFIEYKNGSETSVLSSNNVVEGQIVEGQTTHRTKTTFLSPTKMQKAFSLSFLPTTSENGKNIQVDSVIINYYPYVESHVTLADGTIQSYMELSQTPTQMIVYNFSINGTMTSKKVDEIRLDSKNMTTAGKYEIIRTYKIDEGYSYNENDYYQRTYIFIVDRNDVITSAELTKENQHLESLVGGDVFLSMYDTRGDASLVVTYPNSWQGNDSGKTLYNNGSIMPPKTTIITNKMPVKLYIPKYKYTTYTNMRFDADNNYNFNVNYNFDEIANGAFKDNLPQVSDYMNFFKVEELQIAEYVLSANIYKGRYDPRNLYATASPMVDKYDQGGNSYIEYDDSKTTNGFLILYDTSGEVLTDFNEAGVYYVELFQGRFGIEVAENAYNQSIVFAFEILKTDPDFVAQSTNGASLNSEVESGKQKYYTNQSNINLTWTAGSTYIADIDIPEIEFKTSKRQTFFAVEHGLNGLPMFDDKNGNSVKDDDENWIWSNIFVDNLTPATDTLKKRYVTQISLEKLGIYENGGWVDITMKYQNHNDDYYNTVTKRIYVDLEAPSNNIQNLVNLSVENSLTSALQPSALRTYYTAKMAQTQSLGNTSYNISNNTGTFAYYSYTVDQNFLQTLKNSLSSMQSYKIYAKEFKDANGTTTKYVAGEEQETSPADFLPSNNYTLLAGMDGNVSQTFTFNKNSYYEIVETDRAGNMAIYTIYIVNYDTVVGDESGLNNLVTYTVPSKTGAGKSTESYTIDDYNATKTYPSEVHNIFASTGFQLKGLNYFGDAWTQIKFEKLDSNGYRTTYNLLLTPWDNEHVYAYSGTTYTALKISDLIDGSTSSRFKSVMHFYNRHNSKVDSLYINIRNTTLSASLTNSQNDEYIRFAMPNDASIKNTIYATTYLAELKISTNAGLLLYEAKNKIGFASKWASNENIQVLYDSNSGTITFKLSPTIDLSANTKIYYEYKDNYGTEDKQIHIYKETVIEKVVDADYLYAYYDTTNGRLYYITENNLKYNYNRDKYQIEIYEMISGAIAGRVVPQNEKTPDDPTISQVAYLEEKPVGGYRSITITHAETDANGDLKTSYRNTFAIQVKDADEPHNVIQTVYFTLYRELPTPNDGETEIDTTNGTFRINDANNNNITKSIIGKNNDDENGYFSEIRISYNLKKDSFIPIKYSVSTDGNNWRELANGDTLKCENDSIQKHYLKVWYDEAYLKNEVGASEYVFDQVPSAYIYEFNLSALTQTYWVEQTINGQTFIVEKSNKIYKTQDGRQFSNHYIVNVDYADRNEDPIKTNKELKIEADIDTSTGSLAVFPDGAGVYSELWVVSNKKYLAENDDSNIPEFSTYVVISYIPIKNNFVEEFYASNEDGIVNESENLVNLTSKTVVINETSTVDQMELRWTKYYGIPQNEINIKIIKDGIELFPNVYSKTDGNKQYNYIKLSHSGKYKISLYDSSTPQNVQTFNRETAAQSEIFNLIFLKDVPFTVSYTNILTGLKETSLPINEAVYNGAVSLNIDKNTRSEFYAIDGYPVINVRRNGVLYTEYFQDDTTYIFDKTGYYEVTFAATSNLPDVGKIRQQTWRFTILNENEHRYSYILNRYSNYYIEKVEKDGVDISAKLIQILDVATYTTNGKTYLAELPISHFDQKTGSGTYVITVNTNDKLLKNSSAISKFTFKVKINVGEAPIRVSLKEGGSTTGKIVVSYNLSNVYREMGECYLRIVRQDDKSDSTFFEVAVTDQTTGERSTTIAETGTYYVQVVSPSGNLLYSYKVIREEPLNAAAIIAIAISAVLLIAGIILVVKLRKRISVK